MTNQEHTPGPWKVGRSSANRHRWHIVGANLESVCETSSWLKDDPEGESEANARLIAAAPQLLAALTLCRGQWIHSVNNGACLAAIARATEGDGA